MSTDQSDVFEYPEYVEINQGTELLGEKSAKFYYHVERGEIGIEPGREQQRTRRYSVADILAVKARIREKRRKAAARKKKPEPVLIDWSHRSDVPAGLRLAQARYHDVDIAETAYYESLRKNNDRISMAAFSLDRQTCYAAIQVLPLDERVILDILSGRRPETSLHPDEIQSYDASGPYNLLVTNAVILEGRPHLLYALLKRYMQFWLEEMYPERYIRKVYAQAVSEEGMRLVQHFFMAPLPHMAYNAFLLDLAWPPAAKMIREFKAKLEEKAPLPDELRWSPPESKPTSTLDPAPLYRFVADNLAVSTPAPEPVMPEPQPEVTYESTDSQPASQEDAIEANRPDGAWTLNEFAKWLNISRTTLYEQVVQFEKDGNKYTKIQHPTRAKEMLRYFTPQERTNFTRWRARHNRR